MCSKLAISRFPSGRFTFVQWAQLCWALPRHRSVPTNLKWFPTCSHAHAMFQDRFKDVQVGSRWFSALYILSPNFHMVLKDGDTQLVHTVPTLQKGGKSLQHLVTEFVRFIMHRGHRELALRSDLEPSNLAILDAVRKTCRGLGITVHHEPVPVGSHESNGAAEATLQHIRLRAGMWVQQIENQYAGGKTIFPESACEGFFVKKQPLY